MRYYIVRLHMKEIITQPKLNYGLSKQEFCLLTSYVTMYRLWHYFCRWYLAMFWKTHMVFVFRGHLRARLQIDLQRALNSSTHIHTTEDLWLRPVNQTIPEGQGIFFIVFYIHSFWYPHNVLVFYKVFSYNRSFLFDRYILKDFVNGKLVYCIAPPGVEQSVYHVFPEPRRSGPFTALPVHVRMTKERVLGTEDIDKDFFAGQTVGVGFKGIYDIDI